jgi:hypothetical protein
MSVSRPDETRPSVQSGSVDPERPSGRAAVGPPERTTLQLRRGAAEVADGATAIVVLVIDPAARSGWVIRTDKGVVAYGTAKTAVARGSVVREAAQLARDMRGRLVIVMEKWTVGGARRGKTRWNPITMIGLGDSRGRWLEQMELIGLPRSRVVTVTPAQWRRTTFGGIRMNRDAAKARALAVVRSRGFEVAGDDEAEAILISDWAIRDSEAVRVAAAKKTRSVK